MLRTTQTLNIRGQNSLHYYKLANSTKETRSHIISTYNASDIAGTEQRAVPSQTKGYFIVDVPNKESLGRTM